MFTRKLNTQNLAWFLDLYRWGQLDLDPPYQRKSIWSQRYKEYFIDTVLRNYPSPTIFLSVAIAEDNRQLYGVIDGKQRLTAVIEFSQGVFTTSDEGSDEQLQGKYFTDLPQDLKDTFLDYTFAVEQVSQASREELNAAFDRVNRNVARLNHQELRHAMYDGVFIRLMEQLADEPFWSDMGMATPARVRRMTDVEYVSELFLLTMHGVQEQKETLDQYYSDYEDEIPNRDEVLKRFRLCQNQLSQLAVFGSRYRNLADFYSLWGAVLSWFDDGHTALNVPAAAQRLLDFAEEVNSEPGKDTLPGQYLLAARQGSNKRSNRELRLEILKGLLVEP